MAGQIDHADQAKDWLGDAESKFAECLVTDAAQVAAAIAQVHATLAVAEQITQLTEFLASVDLATVLAKAYRINGGRPG